MNTQTESSIHLHYLPELKLNSQLVSYYYIGLFNQEYNLSKSILCNPYQNDKISQEMKIKKYKQRIMKAFTILEPYVNSDRLVSPTVLVDFETSLIIRATIKQFILNLRQGLDVHLVDSVPLELSHGHALKSAILYYQHNIKQVIGTVTT